MNDWYRRTIPSERDMAAAVEQIKLSQAMRTLQAENDRLKRVIEKQAEAIADLTRYINQGKAP